MSGFIEGRRNHRCPYSHVTFYHCVLGFMKKQPERIDGPMREVELLCAVFSSYIKSVELIQPVEKVDDKELREHISIYIYHIMLLIV